MRLNFFWLFWSQVQIWRGRKLGTCLTNKEQIKIKPSDWLIDFVDWFRYWLGLFFVTLPTLYWSDIDVHGHEYSLRCRSVRRVVKTTYQHFPLDGRPCQNARWVVLTLCQKSPVCVRMHRCTLYEQCTFCPGRLHCDTGNRCLCTTLAFWHWMVPFWHWGSFQAKHLHCDPGWCIYKA